MNERTQRLRRALAVCYVTGHGPGAGEGPNAPSGADADLLRTILAAGVGYVQFRGKGLDDRRQWETAGKIRSLVQQAGALFFVNDRVDLALALGADGVHLGEEDLPVGEARRLAQAAGAEPFYIGFSTADPQEARRAAADGADYISVGNLFGTESKPDAGPPIGCGPLAVIAREAAVPVIGIGGVTQERAAAVIQAGAVGVAVISALSLSPDPGASARRLLETVRRELQALGAQETAEAGS